MKRRHNSRIDTKAFIEAYLRSDYNWQLAEKFGVSEQVIRTKIAAIRRYGVKLPYRYESKNETFVDEMNELIATMEAKKKEQP